MHIVRSICECACCVCEQCALQTVKIEKHFGPIATQRYFVILSHYNTTLGKMW